VRLPTTHSPWVISTHESKYSASGANNKMIATQESNIKDRWSLVEDKRVVVCYAYHGRKGASYTIYSSSLSSMHLMIPKGSSALILLSRLEVDMREVCEEDDVAEIEPEIACKTEPELEEPIELVLFVLARW